MPLFALPCKWPWNWKVVIVKAKHCNDVLVKHEIPLITDHSGHGVEFVAVQIWKHRYTIISTCSFLTLLNGC